MGVKVGTPNQQPSTGARINVGQQTMNQSAPHSQPKVPPVHGYDQNNQRDMLTSLLGKEAEPTQIEVVKAFFVEVPPEHELQFRPIEIRSDEGSVNFLKETMYESRGQITPASVRGVARKLISPTVQTRGSIGIAETWNQTRMAFFIQFEERTRNLTTRSVIQGYTDGVGVFAGMNGQTMFDSNMKLYISAHINLGESVTTGGRFAGKQNSQCRTHNIIRPVQVATTTNGVTNAGKTFRPTDINSYLAGMAVDRNIRVAGNDSSAGTSMAGIASDHLNEVSSQYLAKFLQSNVMAKHSMSNATQTMNFSDAALFNPAAAASGYVREYTLTSSRLIGELIARTSFSGAGFVYMHELERIWPNIINVTHPIKMDKRASSDNRNISMERSAPTRANIIAHALSHGIPAMMNACRLSTVSFVASNETAGYGMQHAPINVGIQHATGMFETDEQVRQKIAMYENTIANDVLVELFEPGETFFIEGQFTQFGVSHMSISVNGSTPTPHTYPNYASNLDSSVLVSTDAEGIEKANYAQQLVNQLTY